jgi:prolyl oligopeptidase
VKPQHALACLVSLVLAACGETAPRPIVPTVPVSSAPSAAATSVPVIPDRGYPPTRREDVVDVLHGVRVADPYRWLEDGTAEEVRAWARAEDAYTRERLAKLPERPVLAKRFRELFDVERIGTPVRRGTRYFFSKKNVGQEKDAVYVQDGKQGTPRVLLDPNTWSTDGSISLGYTSVSYDGRRVAYQVKKNNSDEASLEIIDVQSGKKLPDNVDGAKYAGRVAWNPSGSGFWYVKVPPLGNGVTVADRPGLAEIRFHRLGDAQEKDALVREATRDPKTFQGVGASRDGRYLMAVVQHGWVSSDVYFQDLHAKKPSWSPLVEGQRHNYIVEAHAGSFFVVTDEGAPNYRVFRVDPKRPERAAWLEIVPERKDATIDELTIAGNRLSIVTIKDVVKRLEVRELDGKLAYDVALPEPGSVSAIYGNEAEDEAYYRLESFARAPEVHEISVRTGKTKLRTATKVPADPSRIATEQRFATSKDGTRVPYFVLRDRERAIDGKAPAMLYAYGGFSVALTPSFLTGAFPWLERGGIFVIANLRGGSEYGEAWHQAGMGMRKQNVFDDFIAVAEDLIANRYTSADRLVIRGDSNGGLLVGAALTQRPELFRVALCGVPLLDMLRYHLYGSGKTWIGEYGSAESAAEFAALYAYSPYHHVRAGVAYPSVMLLTADSDDRVDPMHARKFAAILQASSTGGPILLRIQQNAGHGGADKVQSLVEERSDAYAFALSEIAR